MIGAIRLLKTQRWKPDPILCHGLLYLAKLKPSIFCNEQVMHALCGLLKREQGTAFKSKGNPLVFVLASNLLYIGYKDEKSWPNFFIKVILYLYQYLAELKWSLFLLFLLFFRCI